MQSQVTKVTKGACYFIPLKKDNNSELGAQKHVFFWNRIPFTCISACNLFSIK